MVRYRTLNGVRGCDFLRCRQILEPLENGKVYSLAAHLRQRYLAALPARESGVESKLAQRVLQLLSEGSLGKKNLAGKIGKDKPTRYLNELVKRLLEEGYIEYTIPEKPQSRLQKYRLTVAGQSLMAGFGGGENE